MNNNSNNGRCDATLSIDGVHRTFMVRFVPLEDENKRSKREICNWNQFLSLMELFKLPNYYDVCWLHNGKLTEITEISFIELTEYAHFCANEGRTIQMKTVIHKIIKYSTEKFDSPVTMLFKNDQKKQQGKVDILWDMNTYPVPKGMTMFDFISTLYHHTEEAFGTITQPYIFISRFVGQSEEKYDENEFLGTGTLLKPGESLTSKITPERHLVVISLSKILITNIEKYGDGSRRILITNTSMIQREKGKWLKILSL